MTRSPHRPEPKEWRCYHCDDVFTDPILAAEHFGDDRNNPRSARCQSMLDAIAQAFERYGVHRNFHNAASVKLLYEKAKNESETEIQRLRDALAVYADQDNWRQIIDDTACAWNGPDEARPWMPAADALGTPGTPQEGIKNGT